MGKIGLIGLLAALSVAGCAGGPPNGGGVYQLRAGDLSDVQSNAIDTLNLVRQHAGAGPLRLSPELTAAAEAHADDMSRQRRAWAFGSNWSNPYQRIARAGYSGRLVTELYSQSYETELETLTAWLSDPAWKESLMDKDATDMGLAFHQDDNGLTWWVMTLGAMN